jgi:hypothetical protein
MKWHPKFQKLIHTSAIMGRNSLAGWKRLTSLPYVGKKKLELQKRLTNQNYVCARPRKLFHL